MHNPAYCTYADLQQACGGAPADLVQVFDADRDGVADMVVMDAAIEDASAFVDGQINKQVLVPLTIVPSLIRSLTARVAVYLVRAAKRMVDPHTHGMSYEADLKTLEQIRDCTITLGVDPAPIKASARIDASVDRPITKSVSRRRMLGFS